MPRHKILIDITQRLMRRFEEERDLDVEEEFIAYVVHLLARDIRRGLLKCDLNKPRSCEVNRFIDGIIKDYMDPTDPTMTMMKMSWIMKKGKTIDLKYVKEQYEEKFQEELDILIEDILQHPETCSKLQLDQLFSKMQVFIVACYNLGSPKNHVLLKLTAQALNSVIGRSDLQNYVLKKKYHRMEYLKRLAATVGGIVIFNNDTPEGDRQNVRYVIEDLDMAQTNTEEAFNTALQQASKMRTFCQMAVNENIKIDANDMTLTHRVPLEGLQRLNQFSLIYAMFYRCLNTLHLSYENTKYLVNVEQKRYQCVIAKINDTLSMRTAIESELIFPHFVYLSQVWTNLNNFLNHIVELNKLREHLESLIPLEIKSLAESTVAEIQAKRQRIKSDNVVSFDERMAALKVHQTDGNFCSLARADINEFCALTLTITNGLILPAHVQRKLCMNLNISFGFRDHRFARYAELRFEPFIEAFRKVIFQNANLALLFHLDEELLRQELSDFVEVPSKQIDFCGQTEMVVTNDLSVPNWINVTWNVWDYHRETIHLADIRKKQTRDSQTKVNYGQRNAQNQADSPRREM
ncbi:cilia- and flagella-associated protein 206 [Drosophila tropicalis]|uniref:cilia- and flagella-associated protein 206 n=1 Tax=Drosophila tropicalis TaxID=46794 RepID=UPI0035ABC32D